MRSLLTGETRLGAVALSVEPSAAFAVWFDAAGAGVRGVETPHANVVASRHTAPQIVAVFTISSFSRLGIGRGTSAARPASLASLRPCIKISYPTVDYLQPAPSQVVDPRGIHCHGRPMSPRSTVRPYRLFGFPVGR